MGIVVLCLVWCRCFVGRVYMGCLVYIRTLGIWHVDTWIGVYIGIHVQGYNQSIDGIFLVLHCFYWSFSWWHGCRHQKSWNGHVELGSLAMALRALCSQACWLYMFIFPKLWPIYKRTTNHAYMIHMFFPCKTCKLKLLTNMCCHACLMQCVANTYLYSHFCQQTCFFACFQSIRSCEKKTRYDSVTLVWFFCAIGFLNS